MMETSPVMVGSADGMLLNGDEDGSEVGMNVGAAVMKISQKKAVP